MPKKPAKRSKIARKRCKLRLRRLYSQELPPLGTKVDRKHPQGMELEYLRAALGLE